MPLLALLALFIIVPLAELYAILKVSDAIGPVLTILILAADSVIGALLLKSQGRVAWRRFSDALAAGRMPHKEVLDGVLVIFGGAFLLTPGFITDALGILMLVPPTRAMMRALITRSLGGRLMFSVAGAAGRRRRRRYDVDGTASEVGPDPYDSETPRLRR